MPSPPAGRWCRAAARTPRPRTSFPSVPAGTSPAIRPAPSTRDPSRTAWPRSRSRPRCGSNRIESACSSARALAAAFGFGGITTCLNETVSGRFCFPFSISNAARSSRSVGITALSLPLSRRWSSSAFRMSSLRWVSVSQRRYSSGERNPDSLRSSRYAWSLGYRRRTFRTCSSTAAFTCSSVTFTVVSVERHLVQQLEVHQLLDHLPAERIEQRGVVGWLLALGLHSGVELLVHLGEENRAIADHGNDLVGRLRAALARKRRPDTSKEAQAQSGKSTRPEF